MNNHGWSPQDEMTAIHIVRDASRSATLRPILLHGVLSLHKPGVLSRLRLLVKSFVVLLDCNLTCINETLSSDFSESAITKVPRHVLE